jgi:hypothetical protein
MVHRLKQRYEEMFSQFVDNMGEGEGDGDDGQKVPATEL